LNTKEIYVGVDLGGTKIHSVALDGDMKTLAEDERKSGFGANEVTQNLLESIESVLDAVSKSGYVLRHIGIGTPGTVDTVAKIVRHSLNLGIVELDLGEAIRSRFDCTFNLENDVNATALGLSKLNRDLSSLAYLNFGTGLAAGYVINGKVWAGASGLAGEIGHIPIGSDSDECQCGQVGCLELLTTWTGLGKRFPNVKDFSSAVALARESQDAADAFETFKSNAVRSLMTVFLTIDPELIFLGGGMLLNNESVFEHVMADFEKLVASSPLFSGKHLEKRVVMMPRDAPVACIGALGGI
jgi:predicted NBD/HSP70 family sugar kinase